MSTKYSILTEKEVQKGLEEGKFERGGTVIKDVKTKEIVKHLKENEDSANIPSQLFQFTQNINHTIIYQVDIQPYIDKLIKMNNIKLFDELYESYETIIKNLEHYKSYNDELDTLNRHSRDALSKFENNISKYIDELEFNDLKNTDSIINIVNSYIEILFIYLISTYKLYGEKLSNDTIVKKQISWLKDKISTLYKQLLVKSRIEEKDNKKTNIISNIENSLYGYLFFNERNKDNLGIYKIKKYIKYDNRFSSVTDFVAFIQENIIQENNKYHNRYHLAKSYFVDIKIKDTNMLINKQKFIDNLFDILEKIDNLDNIYKELITLNDIDSNEIKAYLESDKSFEILSIN